MVDTVRISLKQARQLAIAAQGLDLKHRETDVMGVAHRLGCIQFDPLNVVARTQLLVLLSRLGKSFDPADLDRALFKDKTLFHYWAHAASFVLTDDYPIHEQQMRAWLKDERWRHAHRWMKENAALRNSILRKLKREGPLPARAFGDTPGEKWTSSGWTDGQSATRMLDLLWIEGKVTIAGRQGLQRIWARTDDWFPDWTPKERIQGSAWDRQVIEKSLRPLGVATAKQIAHHFITRPVAETKKVVAAAVEAGWVVPVEIDGASGSWFMLAEDIPLLDEIGSGWKVPTVPLSPFDNLIRDRERTKTLFDLDFTIEIYVPKAKRRYGYYVLPILDGGKIVALADPKMDRKAGVLMIQRLHEGPGPHSDAVAKRVGRSLRALGTWLGATEVVYLEVPQSWRGILGS